MARRARAKHGIFDRVSEAGVLSAYISTEFGVGLSARPAQSLPRKKNDCYSPNPRRPRWKTKAEIPSILIKLL
jgi:hypothetical protein